MPPSTPFLSTVLNPSSTDPPPTFTPTQQSLQARNKPLAGSPASSKDAEPYEQRQKRDQAAFILENVETLIWYSAARNESLSQTRQHFQNIVLGIEERKGDVVWKEQYDLLPSDFLRGEGSVPSPARSAKGKERLKRTS